MTILWIIGLIVLGIIIFGFLFSKGGEINKLHMMYEVGATAEKRYEVASKMLDISISDNNEKSRLDSLHKTLDVILCEGKIDTIEFGTEFHKNYWKLGNKTAIEIKKLQENLNIGLFWFADDYDSAMKMK